MEHVEIDGAPDPGVPRGLADRLAWRARAGSGVGTFRCRSLGKIGCLLTRGGPTNHARSGRHRDSAGSQRPPDPDAHLTKTVADGGPKAPLLQRGTLAGGSVGDGQEVRRTIYAMEP